MSRNTIQTLQRMKQDGHRFAMVTAYEFTAAQLADRAGIPVILVGDSMGNVVLGYETTLPVTLDDIIRHAAAVVRGSARALVIADLPFLTYATVEQAVQSAGRLLREAGVQAVKLEGADETALATVRRLVELGIPVMGHLGFTPQSSHQIGVRVQAKTESEATRLIDDALALEAAGAFGIVLELVPDAVAARVTERLAIPTVGIGAGPACDGQVQVWHDILGLYGDKTPRHAKLYAPIGSLITEALATYAAEVATAEFPAPRAPKA